MKILLDIDGVLVTTPSWRPVALAPDGFLVFNEKAARNLARIIDATSAGIILTTTHRINYSLEEWTPLLHTRGIYPTSIAKVNEDLKLSNRTRAMEIELWVNQQVNTEPYVIIDDDLSINGLPTSIKAHCVLTKPLIGLNEEMMEQALAILLQ